MGKRYLLSRHNFGFLSLDAFASKQDLCWQKKNKFEAEIAVLSPEVILAKPQTMMNNSGLAVARLAGFYKVSRQDIWLIHDELDLSLGRLKISYDGSSAGHKGIESVIRELGGGDFYRFRLGIGNSKLEASLGSEEFVLRSFTKKELPVVGKVIKRTNELIELSLSDGISKTTDQL